MYIKRKGLDGKWGIQGNSAGGGSITASVYN
jgi:hypothetical protein